MQKAIWCVFVNGQEVVLFLTCIVDILHQRCSLLYIYLVAWGCLSIAILNNSLIYIFIESINRHNVLQINKSSFFIIVLNFIISSLSP